MQRGSIVGLIVLLGCATCPPKPAAVAPVGATIALPVPAPVVEPPAAAPPPPEVAGFWAEYWAPEGRAETQRYVFFEDGHFGWLAPLRDTPKVDPIQRAGHFVIEGSSLVLTVERQRFADGRSEELATPVRMSLEIGECPPNQEAQAVDAAYVCLSIGGRAFWRGARVGADSSEDSARYLR
jgi:hypothetical protein